MTAQEIIRQLGMHAHPEGGWYVETFRDSAGAERAASTAIYYLLARGERSHWHRVNDAVEVWHFYAGAPLRLRLAEPDGPERQILLGGDLSAGQRPQAVVMAGEWQAAESTGDYTLVGCTVAPGFSFSSFEMAPPGWQPGG